MVGNAKKRHGRTFRVTPLHRLFPRPPKWFGRLHSPTSIDRSNEMRSIDRDLLPADPDIWAPDDWREPIFVDVAALPFLLGLESISMPCRCKLVVCP